MSLFASPMPLYVNPKLCVSGTWKNEAPGHFKFLNKTSADPLSNCKLQDPR